MHADGTFAGPVPKMADLHMQFTNLVMLHCELLKRLNKESFEESTNAEEDG